MDGDWAEVKQKKKPPKKNLQQADQGGDYGGKGKKGMLVAGAIKQANTNSKYGGEGAWGSTTNNQASAIADYDYNYSGDEEIKYETVTHTCAASVQQARLGKNLTQTQLAKLVNVKTSEIVDIENGTAKYSAGIISAIEKACGAKVDRGRGKGRRKK